MQNKAGIPDAAELHAYSLGKLDASRAADVELLFASNADWSAILDTAPDDEVILFLRGAGVLCPDDRRLLDSATKADGRGYAESVAALSDTVAYQDKAVAATSLLDPAAVLINHARYQILRNLGEGGMGTVFLAEHRLMHRPVAVKMIRAACLANPQAVDRFRREMQAAALLSHPNIVTAHDAEEAGGMHFLVMEYVAGVPLSDWLAKHGPLPAAEACRYVRQAAIGLQYAHEKGMVHRDLKPHNLMRLEDGSIKIMDFGLARFACETEDSSSGQLTAEGDVMGTPDYMAPEQAKDSRHADIRADIYSLGCTLYHLLAGRVPFPKGKGIDKLIMHATEEPQPLSQLRPNLPSGLAEVVAKMMAKMPADRYQTPQDVAEALESFCVSVPPRLPMSPPPRRRWWIAAGLMGVLTLAVVAIVITVKSKSGLITIQVEDSSIEVVTRKNGELVLIRDTKTNKTWELDTKKLNLGRADDPDGLRIELDGKKPLVLRRQDGRLVTITGPTEPVADKPVEKVIADEPGKPKLLAAGLKAGIILADDNFRDPAHSLFRNSVGEGSGMEFARGYYGMILSVDGEDWIGWNHTAMYTDFIFQATGRVTGQRDASWGVYLDADPPTRSLKIMVRGDGQVNVGPSDTAKDFVVPKVGPFSSPEGFRAGEFNTLVVARQGDKLTIYLNGKALTKPFKTEPPIGRCVCGLMAEQYGKADARAEFQRYTVWELAATKNDKPRKP